MKNKKVNYQTKNYQYPKDDKEILVELSDPNYEGGSFVLPSDASPLEKAKYKICQSIISYHLNNQFTIEETAAKIQLSFAETKRLLHYQINEFTLDRLIYYAANLFPFHLAIHEEEAKPVKKSRKSLIHA